MAAFGSWKNGFIEIAGVNLSDHCTEFSCKEIHEELKNEKYGDECALIRPGLAGWTLEGHFLQDFAAGSVHRTLRAAKQAGLPITVRYRASADAVGVLNPMYSASAYVTQYTGFQGAHGANLVAQATFRPASPLVESLGSTEVTLDQVAIDAGVLNSSMALGPITPAQDNAVIIAAMAGREGPYSINSPFTISDQVAYIGGSNFGSGLAYKIQTTAAAISATWTQTGISMAVILAPFKAVSGAFTLLSHAGSTGNGYTHVTGSINTSGARLIVVALAERAFSAGYGSSSTLTDNKGNAWTLAGGVQGNFNERINLYYCFTPTGGAGHTLQAASWIGIESYPSLCVAAFS